MYSGVVLPTRHCRKKFFSMRDCIRGHSAQGSYVIIINYSVREYLLFNICGVWHQFFRKIRALLQRGYILNYRSTTLIFFQATLPVAIYDILLNRLMPQLLIRKISLQTVSASWYKNYFSFRQSNAVDVVFFYSSNSECQIFLMC